MFDAFYIAELLERERRQDRFQPIPLYIEAPLPEPPMIDAPPVAVGLIDDDDLSDDEVANSHMIIIDMG